jgi:hypothetical protein
MSRWRRACAAAALSTCVGWVGYVAARQAAADSYANDVAIQIDSWSQPGRKFRGDELSRAIAGAARSLEIAPESAFALEEMGALQVSRLRSAVDPQVAVAAARAAHAYFKSSLLRRPSSPNAWANLALAKFYLVEIDAELFDALARSAEYGPWEPQSQLTALFVGLGVWNQASAAQREMILAIRDRAVLRSAEEVTEMAKGFNRPELGCAKNTPKSAGGRACPRAPA